MPDPRSILLVRFSSMGDVLLTTPLVRALRGRYPGADITYLTKAEFAPLLEHNPHVTRVTAISGDSLGGLRATVRGLRDEPFDALIDIHGSIRSRALRRMAIAHQTYTWPRERFRRWLLIYGRVNRYPHPVPSIADRFFAAVKDLGVRPDGEGLELHLPAGVVETVRAHPAAARPYVVLAPGAAWATKRWPPEAFIRVGAKIVKRGRGVVILGGDDDAELAGAIAAGIGERAVALAGRASLLESAAFIDHARAFIGNDTGLMHIATALATPLVAMFGCTVEEFGYFPYRPDAPAEVLEVTRLECRPCTKNGRRACPAGHFRCLRDLTPDDVLAAVRRAAPGVL